MTATDPRTIRVQIGNATLKLRDPATLPAAWVTSTLAQLATVLEGRVVQFFTGAERLLGDPTQMRPAWAELIVDIDGVDGYHDVLLARAHVEPLARLGALAANGTREQKMAAAKLLADLAERSAASILRDVLTGRHTEPVTSPSPVVGEFVGLGIAGISRGGVDFAVDEATGCVTHELVAGVA